MRSLRSRLMLTYGLVSVFSIAAVLFSANFLVDFQFKKLVENRIAQEEKQYLESLPGAYTIVRGWDPDTLAVLGMDALEKGYILKLVDDRGRVVWDARTHNDGLCEAMLLHMSRNMDSRYPGWNGTYQEQTFPVTVGFGSRATASFGFYGPFFFNDAELAFLQALNFWTLIVGILALGGAAVLGLFMARWISRPIQVVTKTAHELRLGNWTEDSAPRSSIREIQDLSFSIHGLRQSLKDQENLRKRLTADMSHELRTPLSVLRGRLEATIDGVLPSDPEHWEILHQEVLRLTRLVDQLENLNRIENHLSQVQASVVEAVPLLNRLAQSFQAQALTGGVNLVVDAHDFSFEADEDKTWQILFNLLSNALKHTPSGGTVTLGASRDRETVTLFIRDTGIGISEKDLPYVFERFYRADTSRARATGGAGIGLSIARSLAEIQGGSLTAASQPDAGSLFTLNLPAGAHR